MTFSNQLKKLRVKCGLTQEALGIKLNINRSTIGGYEAEGREPDFSTLILIADFFDVSIDYLLGKSEKSSEVKSTKFRPDEEEILNLYNTLTERNQAALIERSYALLESQITPATNAKEKASGDIKKGTA